MSTIKLNDTQLVVLTAAAKAAAPIGVDALTTLKAKGGARTRAVNGLLKRGWSIHRHYALRYLAG